MCHVSSILQKSTLFKPSEVEVFGTEATVQPGPLELNIHMVIFGGSAPLCCSAASGDQIRREITKITARSNTNSILFQRLLEGIRISTTCSLLQTPEAVKKTPKQTEQDFCSIGGIYLGKAAKTQMFQLFNPTKIQQSSCSQSWRYFLDLGWRR